MRLTINPTIIYRTPKFPLNAVLEEHWEELKDAIRIASPDFYNVIKNVNKDEVRELPQNVFFTIWKYFNRAKYRATPFASFAGFGLFKMSNIDGAQHITINSNQVIHELTDWTYKDNIETKIEDSLLPFTCLLSNSTYYVSGNRLRYIGSNDTGFELCEEEADNFTLRILTLCQRASFSKDLTEALIKMDFEVSAIENRILEMVELQLLFTDKQPNIIGQDYFDRLQLVPEAGVPKYIIAERPYIMGNIKQRQLRHLPELMNLLAKISPPSENKTLDQFIQRFQKKFEQQEIPLMIALDPEMGVGYNGLEQSNTTNEFAMRFVKRQRENKSNDQLVQFVLRQMMDSAGRDTSFLRLEDFPIQNENPPPYPNSINAVVTLADDQACLDYIGGATANALLGRFTLVNHDLLNHSRTIAKEESASNPDVLFFDIAYMCEGYVDNINRRESIYDYRLSILNYDTSKAPLMLCDLLVSVNAGQLILRSESMGIRLVPKMASAYNYTRSDLPIFRLLCDLQYQGVTAQPWMPLESLVKDLNFYPRVQFKNIIVSAAKWRVEKEDFFKNNSEASSIEDCRKFLIKRGINKHFKTGNADQTLCFNLWEDEDMNAFLYHIGKVQKAMLQEVIIPTEAVVKDHNDRPYYGELVLTLQHTAMVYPALKASAVLNASTNALVTKFYPPAKDWLYFEIYCHPQRADLVLRDYVVKLLQDFSGDIKQWFFIRYNENGDHIRLRLKLHQPESAYRLTKALNDLLSEDMQTGVVVDLQIKTYKREMQRYHADMIDLVELHFCVDSNYVLSLIQDMADPLQYYHLCVQVIEAVKQASLFTMAELKHFLRTIAASLEKKHELKTSDFKQLNERYKEYLAHPFKAMEEAQLKAFLAFNSSLIRLLSDCLPDRRIRLFGDLIHMHIIRLFNSNQGTHEMIVYYFALKDFLRDIRLQE